MLGYPSREGVARLRREQPCLHCAQLRVRDGGCGAHGTTNHRHIVAVIGDGAMTGGLAYEALNNLGHHKRRVIIVLNDNGRSYAPTQSNLSAEPARPRTSASTIPASPTVLAGKLADALTDIRLNPVYVRRQRRLESYLQDLPGVGAQAERAMEAFKAGVREFLQPPSFFEALGVRYVGPSTGTT